MFSWIIMCQRRMLVKKSESSLQGVFALEGVNLFLFTYLSAKDLLALSCTQRSIQRKMTHLQVQTRILEWKLQREKITIELYFFPHCPYYHKFYPVWKQFKQKVAHGNTEFHTIDISMQNIQPGRAKPILPCCTISPTIVFSKQDQIFEYVGKRNLDSLSSFFLQVKDSLLR